MNKVKKLSNKKRKMDAIEEEPQKVVVDVNALVNKWMEANKGVAETLLNIVNKLNELESKLV